MLGRYLDRLLLASVFVVISTSTILWTLRDRTPPSWDPSDHLRFAYDYYRPLAHADLSAFARELFITPHPYAPLVHLVSAGIFVVFGASRLAGIVVNLLSLAILLWAVAAIWNVHTQAVPSRNEDTSSQPPVSWSALPALVACSYHSNAWLIHDAFLDFPLIAAVTGGFALLMRADDFRVRRDALAFGFAAGIGMLVKQGFFVFFVLPMLSVVIRAALTHDRRAAANLALATVAAISIAGIWYGPHWADVVAIYGENRQGAVNASAAPALGFDSHLFYVDALMRQTGLPFAALFAVGVCYSLVRCRGQSSMLYLWMLSGLVGFSCLANKDVRYTAPVLPAAALL